MSETIFIFLRFFITAIRKTIISIRRVLFSLFRNSIRYMINLLSLMITHYSLLSFSLFETWLRFCFLNYLLHSWLIFIINFFALKLHWWGINVSSYFIFIITTRVNKIILVLLILILWLLPFFPIWLLFCCDISVWVRIILLSDNIHKLLIHLINFMFLLRILLILIFFKVAIIHIEKVFWLIISFDVRKIFIRNNFFHFLRFLTMIINDFWKFLFFLNRVGISEVIIPFWSLFWRLIWCYRSGWLWNFPIWFWFSFWNNGRIFNWSLCRVFSSGI